MSFWTKCPNELIDLLPEMTDREIQLIFRVLRHTVGRKEEWAELGESQLLEETRLSRSTLYEAKDSLEEDGFLEVDRDRRRCAYRLGNLAEAAKKRRARREGASSPKGVRKSGPPVRESGPSENPDQRGPDFRTQTRPESRTPSISKEREQENLERSSSTELKRTPPDDAFFRSEDQVDQVEPGYPGQRNLVRRMREVGVDELQAERLSRDYPPELLTRCLDELPLHRNVRNPAAHLVAAIKAGGFSVPVDQAEVRRKARAQRASAERQAEAAAGQAEQLRTMAEWDFLAGAASPEELREAEAAARKQLPPRMAAAPVDSPMVRGLMLDHLRNRAGPRQGVA